MNTFFLFNTLYTFDFKKKKIFADFFLDPSSAKKDLKYTKDAIYEKNTILHKYA